MSKAKAESADPVEPAAEAKSSASAALTPEQIAELQARAAEAGKNRDNWLRTAADFDNFRKRAAREKDEAIRYANGTLLQKLLPILDNFEAALAAAQNPADGPSASFRDGVAMIQQQLKTALAQAGLEDIEALGQPFDPNFHEAVSTQESAEAPDGHVLQQLRKGYKIKDRLLRPATVVVAKLPAPQA